MITQTTANVANRNQVNTNYRTASTPAQSAAQDSYTPSVAGGDQPISYKQMLAASAGGGAGNAAPAAAGGGGAKSKSVTIQNDDYGVDPSGNKIDPSKLAKAPITSGNTDLQNQLNYLYSTKTGKAELDAMAKDHPGTTVVMGGPKGYKWGKDQGGVTIHDDKTNKDTIYINPAVAAKSNPMQGAGLIAHEGWHVLSPYKNTLAQEKTADDMRLSVTEELQTKNYGTEWAKSQGMTSVTWGSQDGIYKADYHEYDGTRNKPAIGDTGSEGTAAGSAGIPLDSGVVARGDAIFTKESKGKTTNEVLK